MENILLQHSDGTRNNTENVEACGPKQKITQSL
jgi:hypothetical protein